MVKMWTSDEEGIFDALLEEKDLATLSECSKLMTEPCSLSPLH